MVKRYKKRKSLVRWQVRKTAAQTAQIALNMALVTRGLLNVEYKLIDIAATNAVMSDVPTARQLTNSIQGDSNTQRNGNQLKIKSIYFQGSVQINSAATGTSGRILIVQDKQTNGAQFTSGEVLQDITTQDNIVSPYNTDGKYRFRVLYDKKFTLSTTGKQIALFKFYKKCDMHIRYDGNAGSIADLSSNSLSLLYMSSEATNDPLFTYYNRVRYVDN